MYATLRFQAEGVICRLQVGGHRLQVAGCRLQVASYRSEFEVRANCQRASTVNISLNVLKT